MSPRPLLLVLTVSLCSAAAPAQAVDWFEDFDSYPVNTSLSNPAANTGWEEWDDNWSGSQTKVKGVAEGAAVRSAPHSIWTRGNSDTVHQFNGNGPKGEGPYTSGRWSMGSWVYKPVTTTAFTMNIPQWYILTNTYNHNGPYNWSVQINLSPMTGTWTADTATTTYVGAAVFDRWVELRCDIDFDADSVELFYDGAPMGPAYTWNGGVSGFGSGATALGALDLFADGAMSPTSRMYWDDMFLTAAPSCGAAVSYCTAGSTASGCRALLSSTGSASASAPTGFSLIASAVEGARDGTFFFGANGRQATPWGNGTSYYCVVPPVRRTGKLAGSGTPGACDGSFAQDLNALWTLKPWTNPGAGATTQAQLWFRDPGNTSNRTTSFSDALEFTLCP